MDLNSDVTFEDVCKFIQRDDASLFRKLKPLALCGTLFGSVWLALQFGQATAIATDNPVIAGTVGVASAVGSLADLLSLKGEFQEIASGLVSKLHKARGKERGKQYQRMYAAYVMIVYAAFFEALESLLPEIVERLKISSQEKVNIWRETIPNTFVLESPETGSRRESTSIKKGYPVQPAASFGLTLPRPSRAFVTNSIEVEALYTKLTDIIYDFFEVIVAPSQHQPEAMQAEISAALNSLPSQALECFYSYYLELARECPEFYLWANLYEHLETRLAVNDLEGSLGTFIEILKTNDEKITFGMNEVSELVKLLPERTREAKASNLLAELRKHYEFKIKQPVFKDEQGYAGEEHTIIFPAKEDIFIQQHFKFLEYANQRLDQEDIWGRLQEYSDVGTYLVNCLSSKPSSAKPIIVLGHPGSGKSTLTSMLAARLATASFTPIRVELRNVVAGHSIASQVEDALYDIIQRRVTWADIADACKERPLLLILDGYDELLQASGKVYGDYLREVMRLQEDEIASGREPIQVIVTSRMNLIHKADIPPGATIVCLLDFDTAQMKAWTSVWNETNKEYFHRSHVQEFVLPIVNEGLLALAGQPLMLIMLALYDSEKNALCEEEHLSQANLYEHLIQRFLKRQRHKEGGFRQLSPEGQEVELEHDRSALGAIALGVTNRAILAISADQVRADLDFFGLNKTMPSVSGEALTYGETLLNGFFFAVQSQAITQIYRASINEFRSERVYEFLHKTFGEYLAADFIAKKLVAELDPLLDADTDPRWRVISEGKLASLDGFSSHWYAPLMYKPLNEAPVLVEMLLEQLAKALLTENESNRKFLNAFERVLYSHLGNILDGQKPPSFMMDPRGYLNDKSLFGYLSTYTLNLIHLWVLVSGGVAKFDRSRITPNQIDRSIGWEQLVHLWRTWFTSSEIEAIAHEFTVVKVGDYVRLSAGDLDAFRNAGHSRDQLLNELYDSPLPEMIDEKKQELVQMHFVSKLQGDNVALALSWNYLVEKFQIDTLFDVRGNTTALRHFGTDPYLRTLVLMSEITKVLNEAWNRKYAEHLMHQATNWLRQFLVSTGLSLPPTRWPHDSYSIVGEVMHLSIRLAISLGDSEHIDRLTEYLRTLGYIGFDMSVTGIKDILDKEFFLITDYRVTRLGRNLEVLDPLDEDQIESGFPEPTKEKELTESYFVRVRRHTALNMPFSESPLPVCLEAVEYLVALSENQQARKRYAELLRVYEPQKMQSLTYQTYRLMLLANYFKDTELQWQLYGYQMNNLLKVLRQAREIWAHDLVSIEMLCELIRITFEITPANVIGTDKPSDLLQLFYKTQQKRNLPQQDQSSHHIGFEFSPALAMLPKRSLEYLKLLAKQKTQATRALVKHINELLT